MYYDDDLFDSRGHDNNVPFGGSKEFVYTILDQYKIDSMHHTYFDSEYDGIVGSGMGGSAAAACAIVAAISKRLNLNLSKKQIAETAWEIENKKCKLFGGKQDQYAASFGGFNFISFNEISTRVVPLENADKIIPSILLFSTGITRTDPKLQENLKELSEDQLYNLHHMKALAVQAVSVIQSGDIKELGRLLNESWVYKKATNKVSTPQIDNFYKAGIKNGAYGGKLLGSGQGGMMIFIVDPDNKEFIKNMEAEGLENWDFDLDRNGVQTRILPR